MTTRKLFSLAACLCVGWLASCDNDRYDENYVGRLSLSLENGNGEAPSAGRISAANVSKVLVSIETSGGSSLFNLKELELFKFGSDYFTEELELPAGSYKITKFLAVDPDNNVVYATPATGSALAQLVEHPLPVAFTIEAGITNNLVMEVVSAEDQQPSDFGYVAFEFKIVETISISINAEPADHTLEVIAKDAALGNVKWSASWNLNGPSNIRIPAGYAHYTFKVSKEGFLPHVQHYLGETLGDSTELMFELLDSNPDDYITKTSEDNGITVYFPKDNCKLYTRVDVAEGYNVTYIFVDKGSDHFVECFRYCRAVNIFDNIPLRDAGYYCSPAANVMIEYTSPTAPGEETFFFFLQEW